MTKAGKNVGFNKNSFEKRRSKESSKYTMEIIWSNVVKMILIHMIAIYATYLYIIGATKWSTIIWFFVVAFVGALGVQTGAHRLWSHRAYRAKWPLRVLLMILQTVALQTDIYAWSRDHRVHHKYSETDADPHNAKRGFFFSHMGWLMVKKHPEVIEKGKNIDLSDLKSDPVVQFQRKHYRLLALVIWGLLPCLVPVVFFKEPIFDTFAANVHRYVLSLHSAWLVNSAAHLYGFAPYDKNINPKECLVHLTNGEGYHNYHHTFPWDYSASEYGPKDFWNPATAFINFFATIGWAYDLKKVDKSVVLKRMNRTGDLNVHSKSNFPGVISDYIIGFFILTWSLWTILVLRLWLGQNNPLPIHLKFGLIRECSVVFKPLY